MAKGQRKKQYIPYERVRAIIEKAPDLRTRAFMALMYSTGCRIGEICRNYQHYYKVYKTERKGEYTRRVFQKTTKEITHGMRRQDITQNARALYIILPNFKFKSMKNKRAYISKKAEGWLCVIILAYLQTVPENGYLFNFTRANAYRILKKSWPYTTHSFRYSRSMHLYYDMDIGLYEIKDQLGHASLNTLTSYLKSRPEKYLEKMEKAKLPEVI